MTVLRYLAGERIVLPKRANWGVGQVLEDSNDTSVAIFFEKVGRKILDLATVELKAVETGGRGHPALEVLLTEDFNWTKAHHNVYVVELKPEVWSVRKFQNKNPHFLGDKLYLYVGMTGLSPKERFRNHKRGHKANYLVREFGLRLLPHFYKSFNPMPYKVAAAVEANLADRLRKEGFAVGQN
jgi:hypothetical protein